jgi:hypothetical protein
MVTIRRGTPNRRAIAVAAIGSVGATTAPSTNEAGQLRPVARWATAATPSIVATTRPIASRPIGFRFARKSRRLVKNDAA